MSRTLVESLAMVRHERKKKLRREMIANLDKILDHGSARTVKTITDLISAVSENLSAAAPLPILKGAPGRVRGASRS